MTTFQSLIYAVLEGITTFLPVSPGAHRWAVGFFTGWEMPSGPLLGVSYGSGVLAALLIYFRHDFASILSSFLRVCLLFQKPRTLDERMPFYILMTALPVAGLWLFLGKGVSLLRLTPFWVAGGLVLFTIPLLLGQTVNRQTKNFLSWNIWDALIVGLTQMLAFIPTGGRQIGAFTGAFIRNYQKEAALKFVLFSYTPILIWNIASETHGFSFSAPAPMEGVSWLTFWVSSVVCFIASLLALGGLHKTFGPLGPTQPLRGYAIYRLVLALGIIGFHLIRA